ncbi:MAG TPA: hypothetical protein VN030_13055 [Cellvibrio sp.]|nr:hypothetical protein [Cellvibrio sp.]
MSLLFFLLTLAACCLFYLSLPQQRWLPQPGSRYLRWIAVFLLMVALLVGFRYFSIGTSIFALLAIIILLLSLLPFTSLLRKGRRHDD